MEDEVIYECNKLIAEFMGGKLHKKEANNHSFHTAPKQMPIPTPKDFLVLGNLKYHSSFDWIMPVVTKIESLGYNFRINSYFKPKRIHCNFFKSMSEVFGDNNTFNTKEEAIYSTVVSFIKSYNKTK